MEYMTVREAAKKWDISERLVQKLCAQGRIQGVKKFGISWGVPADAQKPGDPRKEKEPAEPPPRQPSSSCLELMPLMNTPFVPGHCMECIEAMEDGSKKGIALAEYHYFSAHPEEAAKEVEPYLASPDMGVRLSACLIYAYANLSLGDIQRARFGLDELKSALDSREHVPEAAAASAFVAASGAVLLHLPLPDGLPGIQGFLSSLPPGLRAFALYVQAHYLYLKGVYGPSAGIVEGVLAMGATQYPIPAIYLHLMAVIDYISLRQTERAKAHLLAAWEIARPDDLIEGFGEHHGLLGGMLEAVIKPNWPQDFKRIIDITYRFSAGWRRVHNADTGHNVADNLTTTEFAVSMLAARGWSNPEIAEHLHISLSAVKRHLSNAMMKLDVSQRRDLQKFMLR